MEPRPLFFKSAIGGFLIFLIAAVSHVAPGFFTALWHVLASGDIDDITAFILSFEDTAWYAALFLTTLVSSIGFPPAIFFGSTNVAIFGLKMGILTTWIGEVLGAAIAFIVIRSLFRPLFRSVAKGNRKLTAIAQLGGRRGYQVMVLGRLIPYFPAVLLNIFGALSSMTFREYIMAAIIGKFPAIAVESVFGADILSVSHHPLYAAFVILFTILLYTLFRWYDRRKAD